MDMYYRRWNCQETAQCMLCEIAQPDTMGLQQDFCAIAKINQQLLHFD